MTHDYTDLINQVEAAATQLQAEIDAAIDEHGVLRRFIDELTGKVPSPWVAITSHDLDVPIEEVRAGLLTATPKPRAAPKLVAKRGGRFERVDYSKVAPWINTAKAEGRYSVKALAAAFGVPETTAKNWAGHCKAKGLLDAALPPGRPPTPVAEPAPVGTGPGAGPEKPSVFAKRAHVLACTECDFECAVDHAHDLNRHYMTEHGRRPSNAERMPVAA